MARRRAQPQEPEGQPRLTVSREQVAGELDERIRLGENLFAGLDDVQTTEDLEDAKADYYTWSDFNTTLLKQRFTTSELADAYGSWGVAVFGPKSPAEKLDDLRKDLLKMTRRLRSVRERLPLFEEPPELVISHRTPSTSTGTTGSTIFVVHGHDEAAKLAVHGFLRTITSLKTVILHDEASQGQTIIEKFEEHASEAAFAVVILTGDDRGGPMSADPDDLSLRGRQNVVFEHGFFTAALGRSKVAILYEDGVELPSDLNGLLYIPLGDADAWKLPLARELKAAKIPIDPDALL